MKMRGISAAMAAVLFFAAALQINDPDPIRWMLIYGVAAMLSLLLAAGIGLGAHGWMGAAVLSAVAAIWALAIVVQLSPDLRLIDLFASVQMKTAAIEEGREALGLGIVAIWMGVVAWKSGHS
jgi:hypothetical protein